jgi:hypothetical protein
MSEKRLSSNRLLKKQERRETAKLLKHTRLSLPVRYRLAKFHINGKASGKTSLVELVDHLGLKVMVEGETFSVYGDNRKGRITIRNGSLYSELQEGRRKRR